MTTEGWGAWHPLTPSWVPYGSWFCLWSSRFSAVHGRATGWSSFRCSVFPAARDRAVDPFVTLVRIQDAHWTWSHISFPQSVDEVMEVIQLSCYPFITHSGADCRRPSADTSSSRGFCGVEDSEGPSSEHFSVLCCC